MTIAFARRGQTATAPSHAIGGESSSDETLIRRIAGRDKLAMQALFARYQVRVYRFALRIVRDETLAEDLISDVFIDVWRQAAQFEARATVSTWLLAIAKYKALSALRRRTEMELDSELAATIPDPADSPEVAFQKKNSILGSPHNPKFLWVDDAKIVGDRITEGGPVPGNCFA
jgi:Sigma-70 region 2